MEFNFDIKKLFKKQSHEAIIIQIESVRQNIKSAVKYLKNNLLKSNAFHTMPWYLLIGEKFSGKSQLIQHSSLSFLEQEKFVQMTPADMDTQGGLNWWISSRAVIIDVPGHYLENHSTLTPARAAWLECLTQIKKVRYKKPINGIIFTVDIQQIFHINISHFKNYLLEISHQFKQQLPLYIFITKLDKLQGFFEFFDDLGKNERNQSCGLTFPLTLKNNSSWSDLFTQQFDQFIHHLHQRALWRIHHETDQYKRQEILNFPHQLNYLKDPLKKIIYQFSTISQYIYLRGVYFTSSHSDSQEPIDYIEKYTQNQFNLIQSHSYQLLPQSFSLHTQLQKINLHNSFFIPDIFEKKILTESHLCDHALKNLSSHWENLLRWGALALSGIILFSTLAFFSHEYQHQTLLLNTANTALSDYKLLSLSYHLQNQNQNNSSNIQSNIESNIDNIKKLLPSLNALKIAADNTKQAHLPWLLKLQLHNKTSLSDKTYFLYHKALANQFIPALRSLIESQLKNQSSPDSTQLYGLLKIYLMLGSPDHFDTRFLKYWFNHDFININNNYNLLFQDKNFQQHLNILFNFSPTDKNLLLLIPDNTNLVSETRSALNALPYSLLTQAVFKNNFMLQNPNHLLIFNLSNNHHSFIISNNNINKNKLIFNLNLNKINSQQIITQINQSIWESIKGNWVLGDKPETHISNDQIAELQKTLISNYQSDQKNLFQQFINQIKLNHFSNLETLNLSLQELTSKNSPLIQIINFMEKYNLNNNNNYISNKNFKNKLLFNLNNLHKKIIQPILNSTNIPASSLLMAQKIARQSPERILFDQLQADFQPLPEPLKNWLLQITRDTQQIIFNQALQYSSSIWSTQILPICQLNIHHNYPFDRQSNQAITLNNFSKLFEKNGILYQYFNIYISPFVDTSHPKWQWKNINHMTLSQNNNFLAQFQRANIIQALFFNKNNQLDLPFDITINHHITHYRWPVNTKILDDDQHIIATGEWSIFKLIQQGKLISNQQNYNLLLKNPDNKKNYNLLITPDMNINPFMGLINNSNLLAEFNCPDKLTS